MDFTREPVIQTVITPKEGCKLVVRSSKGLSQEEYFVDSVEVVAFGTAFFFRSLEKPKSFLLPVADYEVLEVRETRMVLKHVGQDRSSIKIGGGREAAPRPQREREREPAPAVERQPDIMPSDAESEEPALAEASEGKPDPRLDKKRDRRRHHRRRRGAREEGSEKDERTEGAPEEALAGEQNNDESRVNIPAPGKNIPVEGVPSGITNLLPPPPMLISETIARYREDALFKEAFYAKKTNEELAAEEGNVEPAEKVVDEDPAHPVIQPETHHKEGTPEEKEEALWNFTQELSNNPENKP